MRLTVLVENTAGSAALQCVHGLSFYLEAAGKRILFDMGPGAQFAQNAQALGVALDAVDFAVLSHGHYDHGGGLDVFLRRNDHAPVLQMSTDERFFAFAVKTAFADSHHRFDQTEKPPEAYGIRFRRFYWVWARKKTVQSFSSQAMPAAVRCAAWWEWLPGCS